MTYISSQALTTASRQAVMNAQAQLAQIQTELSSGSYADVGLELGATSGQFLSLINEQNNLNSITNDNALTTTRLSATQTAMTALQTAASSFLASLTSATSGGNATAGVQETATGNLASLISTLNTSVGGQFIFAGINTAVQPVQPYASGSASKTAVDDAFQSAFGTSQTSSDASSITGAQMQTFLSGNFADLFSDANYTSTWSQASSQTISSVIAPGQQASTSVSANATPFQQLAEAYTMVSEFGGAPMSNDASQAAMSTAESLVSSAISGLVNLQAGVGVVQSEVSSANDSMSAQINLLTVQTGGMSQLDDTQTYNLTNQVSTLQTQIEASYEVTSKLQQMSLVNYLG